MTSHSSGIPNESSSNAHEASRASDFVQENYSFPKNKLKAKLQDSSKTPLLLVACGSFNPPTFLHLRIFEIAADYVKQNTNYEVIGGYLSPVGDAYEKPGLVSADKRIDMCSLATENSNWVMMDPWEAIQTSYQPTAIVLNHFADQIKFLGGVESESGEKKEVHVSLLAGADLISTMSTPGVWSEADLDIILGKYGCFIIERAGTNIDEALVSLQRYIDNIYFCDQFVQNDVSSTKVRMFLKKSLSIRYLIPESVIAYIENNNLYGQ